MAQSVILNGIYACIWVGGIRITPPTQSRYSPSYISLHDHPGVGQTHVPFCAKEPEAFLQIPLCVVINLQNQDEKKKQRCFQNKTSEQSYLLPLMEFAWDVSIFLVLQWIVLAQAATTTWIVKKNCSAVWKTVTWFLFFPVSWNDFLWIGAIFIHVN